MFFLNDVVCICSLMKSTAAFIASIITVLYISMSLLPFDQWCFACLLSIPSLYLTCSANNKEAMFLFKGW